jgi:hypothetical protein
VQDPLGVPAELVWKQGPLETYAGPLQGGDRVVVLFNNHMNGSQFAADNLTVWCALADVSRLSCQYPVPVHQRWVQANAKGRSTKCAVASLSA